MINSSFCIKNKSNFTKIINNINVLKRYIYISNKYNIPRIILGNSTNTIFIKKFKGFVLLDRIYGVKIFNYKKYYNLHINSGEEWSKIIRFLIKKKIYGLECLAMIPGRVGASIVNNIGAYGIEISNICNYVYIINLYTFKIQKINNKQCLFNYRSSIFNNYKYKNKYMIISVILKIYKNKYQLFNLNYNNFNYINHLNDKKLYNLICNIRKFRIPNINLICNSGSFFKNPLIKNVYVSNLKIKYPNIPIFNFNNKYKKLSAGWLIENSIFNKIKIGNISLYYKNKLIFINLGDYNTYNIVLLARIVRKIVKLKFNIALKNEVLLIK